MRLPAFVRGLIERRELRQLATQINRERRLCVPHHLGAGADGQVVRVAHRFALVAAAGRLGIELDVQPWGPGDVG